MPSPVTAPAAAIHYLVWVPDGNATHGRFATRGEANAAALALWNQLHTPVGVFKYRPDWPTREGAEAGYKQVTAYVSTTRVPESMLGLGPSEELVQTGTTVHAGLGQRVQSAPTWASRHFD
jgi:hypothetical protein